MALIEAKALLTMLPEKIWHDMILTPGFWAVPPAIDAMPMPLSFWAAMTPATCEPWPVSSISSHEIMPQFWTKL